MSEEGSRAEYRPRRRRGARARATELDVMVGRRLRDARLLAGATQEELGRAMGVSFQAVQKYESGENRLSVGRLARAAKVLERPVSYFFVDETASGAQTHLTSHEAELLRNFRNLEHEGMREALLKLTREIVELRQHKRG